MTRHRAGFCGWFCACLLLWVASASAQIRLRDPFEKPPAAPLPIVLPASVSAPEPVSQLALRAVVFDGQKSLINVGGRILGLGEAIAGYTVVEVQERSAVLTKDGARLRLMLDKEPGK